MTYLKLLIVVAAFGLTACISSSETSGPSSPEVVSGGVVTDGSFTEGSLVGDVLDVATCKGALAEPEAGFTLDHRSLTDMVEGGNENLVSFCGATYSGAGQTGPFLSVGITLMADEADLPPRPLPPIISVLRLAVAWA